MTKDLHASITKERPLLQIVQEYTGAQALHCPVYHIASTSITDSIDGASTGNLGTTTCIGGTNRCPLWTVI